MIFNSIARFAAAAMAVAAFAFPLAANATPVLTLYIDDDAFINEGVETGLAQSVFTTGSSTVAAVSVSYNGLNITVFGTGQDFGSFDRVTELNTTTAGAGSAYVTLVASGFSQGASGTAFTSITPTIVGNTLDFSSEVDGSIVGTWSGLASGSSQSASLLISPLSDPYTIVHQAFMAHTNSQQTTTFDATTTVPAPGVIALLGFGLLGVGSLGLRRRRTA